jgi:Amt family ammonium transporter
MFRKILQLSIPLLCLSSPAFAEDAVINTGNTAWLLLSAALVMLMTPGLAFFYGGMVSHKNVVSTLLQNYVALAVIGVAWVVAGYSLAFTEGSPWIGGFSNVMFDGLINTTYGDTGIPMIAFAVFQMMFAIITPALITGAFAERVSFKAWLLIMLLWSFLVYVPIAHWVWGAGGWIAAKGGLDFAGGLVVHISAGFSGLVAALVWGKRTNSSEEHPYDVPMVMLGAALLWFGWFGFNAGSALTSGALATYAFLNTFIAAAVAFIVWMLVDWIRAGKPSAIGGSVGIVVGLVAITPAAGYVTVSSAMIIGAVAAVVCNYLAFFIKKITHLDDALDVFACHGIGGVVGAILTGVYATKAVNPAIAVEGIAVSGETSLFYANLMGVAAVAGFSIVATYIIIKLVNVITPIRVSGDVEHAGLDHATHGEHARYSLAKPKRA